MMKRSSELLLIASAAVIGTGMGFLSEPASAPASSTAGGLRQDSSSDLASENQEFAAALALLGTQLDFGQLARLGTVLDSIGSEGLAELINKVDEWPRDRRRIWLPRLLAHWTRLDPAAATKWMEPKLELLKNDGWFGGFANADSDMVRAWVDNAPEIALDYARQYLGSSLCGTILHNAIFSWSDKSSTRRFEILRSFPEGNERQTVMRSLFSTWGYRSKERAEAIAAAESLPQGTERDAALCEVLSGWAAREPMAAWSKAQALQLSSPYILAALAQTMAKADPEKAAKAIADQGDNLPREIWSSVATVWAAQNPSDAFQWAVEHGVSLTERPELKPLGGVLFGGRDFEFRQTPLGNALRKHPDATLQWIRSLPDPRERERYLELALPELSLDPARLQFLVPELSTDAAAQAARTIGMLMRSDLKKTQEWAATLPPGPVRENAWAGIGVGRTEPLPLSDGPDRDAMLMGMARSQLNNSPVAALERAMEIQDLARRQRTVEDILWEVNREQISAGPNSYHPKMDEEKRQAVHDWLRTAPIPEEWKQKR